MIIRMNPITLDDMINRVGNLCLYAFLILTTYIFLFRYDNVMFIIRYLFLVVGALMGYGKCLFGKDKFRFPIYFVFCLSFLWVISVLGQGEYQNYAFTDFFYTVCYIGISIFVLQNRYSHIISLCLYGFTAVSMVLMIFQGVNNNLILLANSRNFISVLLLSTMLLYYISCMDKKKPILITPVLVYFYINIYATGRSGIIVSGVLTIGLLIYKYINIGNKRLKALMGFLIVIVLVTVVIYITNLDNSIISRFINTNFSAFMQRGIDSNGRYFIWETFIENNSKSISSFFFGSNVSLAMSDGNLHNSFLQSYASFGILGFIIIVCCVVRSFVTGLKKKNYLYLILFAALVLRAFTDRVFFQGYCELYLYYFIFYFVFQDKRNRNVNNRSLS